MRRNLLLKSAALSAGIFLYFIGDISSRVAAQDETEAMTKPKAPAVDPFNNDEPRAASKEAAPRANGKHEITLHEPVAAGKTAEERLETKATLVAKEAPLSDLVEVLSTALDGPVVLSHRKLEEAAISLETPVSYNLKNVALKSGLRHVLRELDLTYLIRDDALVITTPEDAGSQLETRVYDCRDLMKLASPVRKVIQPEPAKPGADIGVPGIPAKATQKKDEAGAEGGYDISDLIKVMTTTVAPDSWDEVGGPGSIYDFKGLVTVSQTQDVHEQVEKLLNLLHQAGGLEEKVKVSR